MERLKWDLVAELAESLGVKKDCIKKWKVRRSVPAKWRLPLIEASGDKITPKDFKPEPRPSPAE